jgi:hypothetical protein
MMPAELQQALRDVEPAAVVVAPRILENMVRQVGRLPGFVWKVPHRKSLIVDRQTLFRHVDQEELALGADQLLPQTVMLLAWTEAEEPETADRKALLRKYWQRLFHASVHMALDNLWAEGKLTAAGVRERVDRLGPVRFAEIRSVLIEDHYLAPDADDRAVYIEFAAVFLELLCFAPHLLSIYFPGLHDIDEVGKLVSADVEPQALYERTRLTGATEPPARTASTSEEAHEYYWKLVHSSDQAAQQGNVVRSAILRQRASRVAPPARAYATRQAALTQLLGLVDRLQAPLELSPAEMEEWRKHLPALLDKADQGTHPVEAALLYDLQKVCLDHEREIYALDLVEWGMSGGRRPIQRPLPSQRVVRVARTLRAAAPRLAMARLNDDDRNQFAVLLQEAVQRSEEQVRARFRPLLTQTLHDVGLNPRNPLEATAFHKVVEELIDRIIASGFVTFGDLRDTLSRSALKLPDLSDPQDFIRGDPLRRLDRRLGTLLDGVYRPSEFYVRWLEQFTALNFGTPLGRLLTLFVTVPFLGAFLLLEMVSMGLELLPTGVSRPNALPDQVTLHAPDRTTLEEYLSAKPDFVTKWQDGQLWVFRRGSEELTGFLENGDVPKAVLRPGVSPHGMNLKAPDNETIDAYLRAPSYDVHAEDPARKEPPNPLAPPSETVSLPTVPGFKAVYSKGNWLESKGNWWIFPEGTNDTEVRAFTRGVEIPNAIFYPAWVLLGFFGIGLLHSTQLRQYCAQVGAAALRPMRAILVDGPFWLMRHTLLKEVIASWSFQLFYWYVFKPLILAGVVSVVFLPEQYRTLFVAGLVFLAAMFFINSRPGQAVSATVVQAVVRFAELLRAGLIPGMFDLIVKLFKQILHLGEALLFAVDSRPAMIARAVLSLVWFPIAYLIRFNMVVLIEPCFNPLKLPIVTIATKLMLPLLPLIYSSLAEVFSPYLGNVVGKVLAWWIMFWSPDVFGFVFWEMKENWSLYRANRRPALGAVSLGGHGETMRGLLQPGFHSGTVPRLFARLRQAERRARRTGSFGGVRASQSALNEVEEAVRLFMGREFCELLTATSLWQGEQPSVGKVTLATNQIRIELQHAAHADRPLCLEFENRDMCLTAGIAAPGWLDQLPTAQRVVVENALVVLYKLAGIDRIRERAPRQAAEPATAAEVPARPFREIPVTWEQCVQCWSLGSPTTPPPRLLDEGFDLVAGPPPKKGTQLIIPAENPI